MKTDRCRLTYANNNYSKASEGVKLNLSNIEETPISNFSSIANATTKTSILDIMHKLCRQVSIEAPGPIIKDCVFTNFVPIEDTPPHGARIKIVCAGACYRKSDLNQALCSAAVMGAHIGIREGAFYSGFEVAGIIESLGSAITSENNYDLKIGQRVIVYPFDETLVGYAELMIVPDLKYIVPIPDNLPMSIAAMLPSGALLAMNAVLKAHQVIKKMMDKNGDKKWKLLIVGTGGLALWAVRIAVHHLNLTSANKYIDVTVASLRHEGFRLAQEIKDVNVVEWNESLYEPQLIERTRNVCGDSVDVVIDFGTTLRSLHRSMHCLSKEGVVLISEEIADKLLPKIARLSTEYQKRIIPISTGSIEQLYDLVNLVAENKIVPPPYSVFPCEQAADVIQKLCNSEIQGRAILRFHDID